MSSSLDAQTPGQDDHVLGGRYLLIEPLARGGMGDVWLGRDEVLGRQVALKVLRRELADDPTFRERFRAEARHAASLSHQGIAAVYDYDDGTVDMAASPFLVMELVPGEPLSELISRQGRLSPAQTLDIVGQAAMALQAAHDGGVIHRDIKPGNLIVTPEGKVKITDFGISRATNSVPLTMTGSIVGTAYYISPEQASGSSVTPASDIYSLGIVAYECLSGRRPFDGDTPVGVALAHVREPAPVLPPGVPPQVAELVARMLAKDPAQRPASAADLGTQAFALHDLLPHDMQHQAGLMATAAMPVAGAGAAGAWHAGLPAPTSSADTDPGFVLPRQGRRVPWAYLGAALALLLVAVGFALFVRGNDPKEPGPKASTPATTSSPSPTATRPTLLEIDGDAYVGQPADVVQAELTALGFAVDLDDIEGPGEPGTVQSVSPDGALPAGSQVTITVIRAPTFDDGAGDDSGDDDRDDGKKNRGKGKGKD